MFYNNKIGLKKLVSIFLFTVLLAGCNAIDSMKEGVIHSHEVADDMNKAIGAKPYVGFNWQNGVLAEVSVTFEGFPAGSTFSQISAAAKTAIAARFKHTPRQILIGFRMEG